MLNNDIKNKLNTYINKLSFEIECIKKDNSIETLNKEICLSQRIRYLNKLKKSSIEEIKKKLNGKKALSVIDSDFVFSHNNLYFFKLNSNSAKQREGKKMKNCLLNEENILKYNNIYSMRDVFGNSIVTLSTDGFIVNEIEGKNKEVINPIYYDAIERFIKNYLKINLYNSPEHIIRSLGIQSILVQFKYRGNRFDFSFYTRNSNFLKINSKIFTFFYLENFFKDLEDFLDKKDVFELKNILNLEEYDDCLVNKNLIKKVEEFSPYGFLSILINSRNYSIIGKEFYCAMEYLKELKEIGYISEEDYVSFLKENSSYFYLKYCLENNLHFFKELYISYELFLSLKQNMMKSNFMMNDNERIIVDEIDQLLINPLIFLMIQIMENHYNYREIMDIIRIIKNPIKENNKIINSNSISKKYKEEFLYLSFYIDSLLVNIPKILKTINSNKKFFLQ